MQYMKFNCYAHGQPYFDISSDPDESFFDKDMDDKSETPEFLQLQEANNICTAAYREVMTLAINAKAWKMGLPPLGSIEDIQQMFKTPASPGMRVESSVERAILPLSPRFLITTMIVVDKWASTFSHITHKGSGQDPTGVFGRLLAMHREQKTGNPIFDMTIVNAEFHLPTLFVPKQKFRFVRFVRSVMEDTWAVVDLSTDYFQQYSLDSSASKVNCQRRPSGVIVRRLRTYENLSEVIWVENVEVKDCKVDGDDDDDMQSGTRNSNLAFDAKHWVNILSSNCRRRCANRKISFISDQVTEEEKNEVSMEPIVQID